MSPEFRPLTPAATRRIGSVATSSMLLAWTCSAPAQDALRYSLAGTDIAAARKRAQEAQPYNLKAGSARVSLQGSLGVGFNSNVNLSETNPDADVILTPRLEARFQWPLRPETTLDLDVSIGYVKYFLNPELDRLIVEPGSLLSFSAYAGDFQFELHERFAFVTDPLETGPVSNSSEYGGFYNTLGAAVVWDLNEATLATGYDHNLFLSSQDNFDYLNRQTHSTFLRLTLQPRPDLGGGLEATLGRTDYDQQVLSDNYSWSVGPFIQWTVSPHFSVTARGGVLGYVFDNNGLFGPVEDRVDNYFDVGFSHRIRPNLSHNLRVGHSYRLGVNAELEELWSIRHGTSWSMIRDWPISTTVFYERGQESGSVAGDDYQRIGFSASVSRRLAEKLSASLSYGLTLKDSELDGRDYVVNALALQAEYRF